MSINNDVIGVPPNEAWIAPTLLNSWVQVATTNGYGTSAPLGFFKDPTGIVRLRGRLRGGTSLTTAFTLPPGYRPEFLIRTYALADIGGSFAFNYLFIATDGRIIPEQSPGNWYQLDLIQFRAA